MKEWWTRTEMVEAGLPGLASQAAISRVANRMAWSESKQGTRKRSGRGGGTEVHYSLFPQETRLVLAEKAALRDSQQATQELVAYEASEATTPLQRQELDARMALLKTVERYQRVSGVSFLKASQTIIASYNSGELKVEEWIRDTIPSIQKTALYTWRKAAANNDFERLAATNKANRSGTGVLEAAGAGTVKSYVLGLISKQPHLTAKPIRAAVIAEFGDELEVISPATGEISKKPCPPLRTFQATLKCWREEHANELLRLTNPDKYKGSVRMVMAGGASAGIHRLKQLWEIDASPADVMTTEGRWHIYACVDVWSRRAIVLVTRTPRAEAVGLLVRRAIEKWGVPEAIKTDNGSDFVAKQTKRLFAALGIECITCNAYSPEEKPHVERFIGTWQRGFAELLPGYIGHSAVFVK